MNFKKIILGIVFPVFTMATVVGVGYSTWYFNDLNTSKSVDVVGEVTDVAQLGTFTLETSSAKFVFDQPTSDNPAGTGLTMEGFIKCTYTEPTEDYKVDNGLKVTVTLELSTAAAEYMTLTFADGFADDATTVDATTKVYTDTTTTPGADFTGFKYDSTAFTFDYIDGKVPSSLTEYETMREKLEGQTILTVKLVASIEKPTAPTA